MYRTNTCGELRLSDAGKEVVDLQRLTMGTLTLDEGLKRGEWRRLTKDELKALLESVR